LKSIVQHSFTVILSLWKRERERTVNEILQTLTFQYVSDRFMSASGPKETENGQERLGTFMFTLQK